MIYLKKIICLLIVLLIMISCDDDRQNFDKAIISLTPKNFSEVNSEYDDYNADLNIIWSRYSFSLIFSTNRFSQGNDFDFIHYDCDFFVNLVNGEASVNAWLVNDSTINVINSQYNEYGPYTTCQNIYGCDDYRFFYTTDEDGNLDIKMMYVNYENIPTDRISLNHINSDSNEGYVTIFENADTNREIIYFASDRDGQYDIYRASGEVNKNIEQSNSVEIEKIDIFNSDKDDHCPFIHNNIMVFASKRAGGYGGYDLWYSKYDDTQWSSPVNFGTRINSEYNEFRPVIFETERDNFFNNLMLFSSDRPGGKGMFDLYYCGLNKNFN
ncbi:MAG: hypothetical protein U9Q98_04060 [Bacteroidota bacterium]|nr:hypothetical protein [Bacteroidota bacterium]